MPSSPTHTNVLILLFRNDLRLHDNPLVQLSKSHSFTHVLPLYVFDDRIIELSGLEGYKPDKEARARVSGVWRCGGNRVKFMTESVFDLQDSLKKIQSDLHLAFGQPEKVVPHIVNELKKEGMNVSEVWLAREVTAEEITTEKRLAKALKQSSSSLRMITGSHTLVHPDDLPFNSMNGLPDVFTAFRKQVEGLGDSMIRPAQPSPKSLPPFPSTSADKPLSIPTSLASSFSPPNPLTLSSLLPSLLSPLPPLPSPPPPTNHPFTGGERSALERLRHFTEPSNPHAPVATYKQTRNGLEGVDYSSKFSGWLATGSISARRIAEGIQEWEDKNRANQSSYWMIFELLWRDYFTFLSQKYGSALFVEDGFNSVSRPKGFKSPDWYYLDGPESEGQVKLDKWKAGETGVPFIDANMNELRLTGFMSNRGRQNVACYLTKDLCVDWRAGAEVFEEELIDYDTSSNWGNWQYVAGVGTDPREDRYFSPIKQAKDYDPATTYIKTFIPILANVPPQHAHHPWTLPHSDPAWNDIKDTVYAQPPKEERSSWKSQYQRSAKPSGGDGGGGRGGKRGGGKPRGKGPGGGKGGGGMRQGDENEGVQHQAGGRGESGRGRGRGGRGH